MNTQNGWKTVTLEKVATRITDGSHNPPKESAAGIPMYSAQNVFDGGLNTDKYRLISPNDFEKEYKRTPVDEGDVLLTIVGTIGRSYVVKGSDGNFALQRSVALIKPADEIDSRFLAYYLRSKSAQEYLEQNSRGVAQKGIYLGLIKKLPIPLPPREIQIEISDKLEELFSELDYIRNLLKASLKQLAYYRGILLNKLIPAGQSRIVKLAEVSQSIHYGFTTKSSKEVGGPKIVRITDIQDDAVDWNQVPNCWIGGDEYKKYKLGEDDILFARSGATVGKTYRVGNNAPDAVFASYLIRIQLQKEKILPEYVSYYFHTQDYWRQIQKGQIGTGQPNFNGTKLSQLDIPLPTLEDQRRIIDQLNMAIPEVNNMVSVAKRSIFSLEILKQSALRKAFAGELNVSEKLKS